MEAKVYRAGYKTFPEKKFIIEFHEGIIKAHDLIKYKIQQSNDENFSPDYDILVDLTDTFFVDKPTEIQKYISFLSEHKEVAGQRKVAIYANSPAPVVMATLYQQMHDNLKQKPRIFSTFEYAIDWLGIDMPVELVVRILKQLRSGEVKFT